MALFLLPFGENKMSSNLGCGWLLLVALCAPSSLSAAEVADAVRVIPQGSLLEARQPQAAVDEHGTVYIAFGSGNDLYIATSSDAGNTFAEPVKVGSPGVLSLGMRRGPRIAVAGKTLVISAIGGPLGKGKDGDLQAWHSIDGGKSWQGPTRVNDEEAAAREGLHAMAAGPKGELACAWLDLRTKGSKIFAGTSTDGGATWGKNVLVYESPSGGVCPCCHPSVAFDPQGNLHVMWRNALESNRDMFVCESTDSGKTFGQAKKLGTGTWRLDVCPMDGGSFAFRGNGEMVSTWRRSDTVFILGGKKREQTAEGQETPLAKGEQPWLAAGIDGPYVVWLAKRPGDLMLQSPNGKRPEMLAQDAIDPVIAADPSGGLVTVCWEAGPKEKPYILAWTTRTIRP